jgi:uncharacterized protein YceK
MYCWMTGCGAVVGTVVPEAGWEEQAEKKMTITPAASNAGAELVDVPINPLIDQSPALTTIP